MSARQFLDCDGDTWTEYKPGWLRLTARINDGPMYPAYDSVAIEDVHAAHGPLTEIRPDVRLLLAGVLEELAEDVRKEYWQAEDPTSERIYERLGDVLIGKARELREETG